MTTKKKTTPRANAGSKKKATKAEAAAGTTLTLAPSVTVTMAPEAPAATPAEVTAAASPSAETATTAKAPLTVGMFQKRLSEKGYYDGAWDGHYGPYTKLWVARFQAAHSLPANGEPTPATLEALGL